MFKNFIGFTFAVVVLFSLLSQTGAQNQYLSSQRMKRDFYIGANGGFLYPEYFGMYKELSYRTNVDWGFSGDSQAPYIYDTSRIYGGFFEPLSFYISSVTNMLTRWRDSTQSPYSIFFAPQKLTDLVSGKEVSIRQRIVCHYSVENPGIIIKFLRRG